MEALLLPILDFVFIQGKKLNIFLIIANIFLYVGIVL